MDPLKKAAAKLKGSSVLRAARDLKARLFGQEITVYPTYGYRAPDSLDWKVPLRVWVHDNRDTPFVEAFVERLAENYFAKDLERPLHPDERARLGACLANIRDVLNERLSGMETISGPEVALSLDTSEVEREMARLIAEARSASPESAGL